MNSQKIQTWFLLILLGGVFVVTFFVLKPFLFAIILAVAFAIVFKPLYHKLLFYTGQRRGIAAALSTATVFIVLFIPLLFLGVQIAKQAASLYVTVTTASDIESYFENVNTLVGSIIPGVSLDVGQYVRQGLSWLLPNLTSIFSNSAKFAMNTFIFFLTFKDQIIFTQCN